jgi:cytosine/adenosine deaminase-related metal-dependent hydrolase
MAYALQARVVFPVDRPPIENGVVTIDGERIIALGAKTQAPNVSDLGDVALLPGLVNCHTHLEFSELARPLGQPGMPFVDWIRLVIAQRGSGAQPQAAIRDGLIESIRCGVTTIGDTAPVASQGYADESVDVTLFLEVIGFSRARAESAFAALRDRVATSSAKPQAAVGVSPHAPYTVSPGLLTRLVRWARDQKLPVAMHLAESREELDLLNSGSGPFRELLEERSMWDADAIPPGYRPLFYLHMLAEAPRALVVHGNYLDEEELQFMGANRERMSLVYCPRTHAYFQHATYPLTAMLKNDLRVALGTDSRASNPDLSLWAEMRHVARAFPGVDPLQILRMGTLSGAEALGRAADVGSITPGKLANLVAIPLTEASGANPDDVLASAIESDESRCAVWLRGKQMSA